MKIFRLLVFLALASALRAALEQDLGQGLSYLRVVKLAADLPAIEKSLHDKSALVLDFRFVEGGGEEIAQLRRNLEKNSGRRKVRMVLISATTPAAVIEAVTAEHAGILTLGARTPALTPDIAVPISSDEDRHAYQAFGGGTPLDKLVNSTLDKRRFDESALLRERATGTPAGAETAPSDDPSALSPVASELRASNSAESKPAKKPEPAPLVDAVLQRAVQLHRTLLALKKL